LSDDKELELVEAHHKLLQIVEFIVEVGLESVLNFLLSADHGFIHLGNHSNQQVQQDDEVDDLGGKPIEPDEQNDYCAFDCFSIFCILPKVFWKFADIPTSVFRDLNISNCVTVSRQEKLDYGNQSIVPLLVLNSQQQVQQSEATHGGQEKDGERRDSRNGLSRHVNQEAKAFEHSAEEQNFDEANNTQQKLKHDLKELQVLVFIKVKLFKPLVEPMHEVNGVEDALTYLKEVPDPLSKQVLDGSKLLKLTHFDEEKVDRHDAAK
jgi:hypothetical protein